MRRLLAATALVLAAAGCALGGSPDDDLLVRADLLFDGSGFVRDAAVLIRDGRIETVGIAVDDDAKRTIDLGDATILPGFIDLHVHTAGNYALVRGGVTTVRDLGNSRYFIDVARNGKTGRLRVLPAGPIITTRDGYPVPVFGPRIALQVKGVHQARVETEALARDGAAVIKIALDSGVNGDWPLLDVAEVRAIVDAAHRHDLLVTAHVTDGQGTRVALAGGVDELAHMPCRQPLAGLMRAVAARGVPVVGTLRVVADFCAYGAPNTRAFLAAGGQLLYGSDWTRLDLPAIDPTELRFMIDAGMTLTGVLRTATSQAGRYLGMAPLGTLAPRAPADLFAVRGDVRSDYGALAEPVLVVAGGEIVLEGPG